MEGALYHNPNCKVLVMLQSQWDGYPDEAQKDIKGDYEDGGGLYILPDLVALATNESKYEFDEFGCAKLFNHLHKDMFLYKADSKRLFIKTNLEYDPVRRTHGMYWKWDVNDGMLNQHIISLANQLQHICNGVLRSPARPKDVSDKDHEDAVNAINSLRNQLWKRYKIFSGYAKNALRQCFKDLNKMDDTIHFNDKVKTGSLMPCLNGVFDLAIGEFRSTQPDDYLTLYCPTMYDPNADDPAVRKFIKQITQNNKGIERFLRQIIAISLDLNIPTKTMPQLFGRTTNNGKTTFITAIKATLGSHDTDGHGLCCEVNSSAFERGKFGTERLTPKLATIGDSRIVFVSEPDKKIAVNTGLLKALTSGGTFQYEGKFKDPGSMQTLFTIIWETNYLLEIDDPTLFQRGTMQVVPFNFRIKKFDNSIQATLSSDVARSTWLNWIIKGYEEFGANRNEFSIPPICKDLLISYQNGQRGVIPTFLDEFFEKDPTQKDYFPCRDAFMEFKDWCAQKGFRNVDKMHERDFKKEAEAVIPIEKHSNVDCFVGVRKKQVPTDAPSIKSVLDQLFSCEMKESEQENATVPVKAVLEVCNRMLESNGLPDMTCWELMDELRKRNLSIAGDVNDPSLAHWRFLTEDEKANQLHKEYEARRQAALMYLEERRKEVKDPELTNILGELIAKLFAPSEADAKTADTHVVHQILSKLSTLQEAA